MWPSTNMGSTEEARFSSPAGLQDGLTPLQPFEFPWGSSEPSSGAVWRLSYHTRLLKEPMFSSPSPLPSQGTALRLDYATFTQPHQLELHPSFLLLVSPNLPVTSHLTSHRGAIGWTVSLPPGHSSPESERAEQSLALVAKSTNSPRQGKLMTHSKTGMALQSHRPREAPCEAGRGHWGLSMHWVPQHASKLACCSIGLLGETWRSSHIVSVRIPLSWGPRLVSPARGFGSETTYNFLISAGCLKPIDRSTMEKLIEIEHFLPQS